MVSYFWDYGNSRQRVALVLRSPLSITPLLIPDDDPYSIKKGFWYAHFKWMFEKPREIENKVVSDLIRNPLINFQHRYYGLLMFATNALAFVLCGWFFQDYFGAFVFAWLLRMFILHHMTWFINSLGTRLGISRILQRVFSCR